MKAFANEILIVEVDKDAGAMEHTLLIVLLVHNNNYP